MLIMQNVLGCIKVSQPCFTSWLSRISQYMCTITCPECRMEWASRDFHFVSLPRCDTLWGGRLPVTLLAAAVVSAPGEVAGESSWSQGGSQEPWAAEENLLAPAAGAPAAAAVAGAKQGPGQALRHHTRCGGAAVSPAPGAAFEYFYLQLCPPRGAPLWEESLPLQQLEKPDPERPPNRRRQPAGGQSSSGGHPGCGFVLPPQAVHPAAASPLADGELRPRPGQRSVAQSEGDA